MQFSSAFVFAFLAPLVASQSASSLVAQLPSCAISCLASASTSSGCGISDYACQCGEKKEAITKLATPCVLSACSQDDALKTNSISGEICKAAGSVQTSAQGGGSYASYFPQTSTKVASISYPATASISYSAGVPTYPAGVPTGSATATSGSSPAATTTGPIQATGAASRVNGGVFAAGAAALAVFVL